MRKTVVCAVAAAVVSIAVRAAVTIDVMFAYDQSAARWLSANTIDGNDLAVRAVEQMNAVLPATHLDEYFSFRLVGVMTSAADADATGVSGYARFANVCENVADAETGVATGAWKDVQVARDRLGADIVVVLVDSGEGFKSSISAGISWGLGKTPITDLVTFAPWAYSVCGVQYVDRGHHVVMHEVGHVMGAGHSDRLSDDPGPQLYPYSSAYHFVDGEGVKRRTIMGYSYTVPSDAGYEPYPAFSSAEFTTPDGYPLGDALHDNTRTLRETCVAVSRFRLPESESAAQPAKFAAKTTAVCKVADAGGGSAGILRVTVTKTDNRGQSKVSAEFYGLDGKKKVAKPVKTAVTLANGVAAVKDVALAIKGETAPLVVTVGADGIASGTFGAYSVKGTESIAVLSAAPRFRVTGMPAVIGGMPVMNDVESGGKSYHLLPDENGVGFSIVGKKWVFAKVAGIKYAKNRDTQQMELVVDTGKDGSKTNLCGVKLSVDAKTGVFRGSFTVYLESGTPENPKLKRQKFKVTGIVVGGTGSGRASYKGVDVAVAL